MHTLQQERLQRCCMASSTHSNLPAYKKSSSAACESRCAFAAFGRKAWNGKPRVARGPAQPWCVGSLLVVFLRFANSQSTYHIAHMRTLACTRASLPCSAGRPVQPAHRCHALVSSSSSSSLQQQLQKHRAAALSSLSDVQAGRARLHGVSCRAQPEGTPTTAEGRDVSAAATTQVRGLTTLAQRCSPGRMHVWVCHAARAQAQRRRQ